MDESLHAKLPPTRLTYQSAVSDSNKPTTINCEVWLGCMAEQIVHYADMHQEFRNQYLRQAYEHIYKDSGFNVAGIGI